MYKHFFKRLIDVVLSLLGIIVLAIPMLVIAIAIKLDSPGPVLFKQERIAIHKGRFKCLKFRTMYTNTPANTPTHLLGSPEQWITRVGRFLRRSSLDELPQLFNICAAHMSIIGPRPALWNQEDLITERDRYGANDIRPGLTGWAQINGRDELEIEEKARLDGEYTAKLNAGGFKAFLMDCRCFIGTVLSVFRHEGVVEGGTGELHRENVLTDTEPVKEVVVK